MGDRSAEVAVDQPLEEDAEERRRQKGEAEDRCLSPVEGAELFDDHLALADEQRRRGAGVQRDAEGLLEVGIPVLAMPAEKPGNQGEVCGARDREELGRSLDRAEDDRPRRPNHEAGCFSASVAGPTRPRRRFQIAYTISATIAASTA